MNTKLTLSLDKEIIEKAKIYAKGTGRSLSEMVENYFKNLVSKPKDEDIHPKVKKIIGRITLSEDLMKKKLKPNIIKKNMVYKNIFLDTNILVDIVTNRHPFSKNAISIFDYCQKSNTKMYSTSHSIATLHYLVKKIVDEKELRLIIEDLLDTISIIGVTESILKKSLKSKHKDFEDAIQIVSAQSINNMDCIVTRDLKDYKFAEISVLTPDDFLNTIE